MSARRIPGSERREQRQHWEIAREAGVSETLVLEHFGTELLASLG